MKKIFFITAFIIFSHIGYSQNSIKLYKVKLKANETLGTGKAWGPIAGDNKTVTFTRATKSLNLLLGQTYTTKNLSSTENFLNIDIETISPLLDSINFSYYSSYAFLKLENEYSELLTDSNYKDFKNKFNSAKTNKKKREILFDWQNRPFKNILEASRFDIYQPTITITNTTEINQKIKAGVSAEIIADIKNKFTLKPELAAVIEDSVSRHIEMKNAKYHEIRLAENYIKRVIAILKNITPTSQVNQSINDEDFYNDFITYYKSKNSGIITGAAVFEAEFDAKKLKELSSSIGLTISGNLDATAEKKTEILKASAEIAAKYISEKNIISTVNTVPTYYYLRYVYDSRLEFGNK